MRKTMKIDPDKLARVRKILDTRTDTQTVDRALELIIENHEIETAVQQCFGKLKGKNLNHAD